MGLAFTSMSSSVGMKMSADSVSWFLVHMWHWAISVSDNIALKQVIHMAISYL